MGESFKLTSMKPTDVVISADGSRIFAAGNDGFLKVYDVTTGALLHNWHVGNQLGAIDVALDGSYLVIVEKVPVTNSPAGWDSERTVTLYKVDTATGAVTSFPYTATDYDSTFSDVTIMAGGKVLLTQNFLGSGWTDLKVLDLATGIYTEGPSVRNGSVLHRAGDGTSVLIAETDISDAPLRVYDPSSGIVHSHNLYADGVSGFNRGLEAYSSEAGLIAQYVFGNGLHIYDETLDYQLNLESLYPQWGNGAVSGLVFSADGGALFVLDNVANTIVELATGNWSILQTIPVGFEVGDWSGGDYGNRLLLSAGGRYLTVVTDTALVMVDDPMAAAVIGTAGDDTIASTMFSETLDGLGGDDALFGNGGNDLLDGGAGADAMTGGDGNDIYYVDNGGDSAVEAANGGRDVIYAGVNFTLGAGSGIEILSAASQGGATPLELTGNEFANEIYGNDGANFLDGGGGADYLAGFSGSDTYIVDNLGDIVAEGANQGRDVVYASASYGLSGGQEIEVLAAISQAATTALQLTGNELRQEMYGNAGANFIDGGGGADYMAGFGGNDTYIVDNGSDYVFEAAGGGRDVIYARTSFTMQAGTEVEVLSVISQSAGVPIDLTGNQLFQELYGNTDSNFLDGGAGADYMQGFTGNDNYIVDTQADVIVEGASEGAHDVVFARASFALGAGVGIEVMSTISGGATTAIDLTGNELANDLYGNAGANVLNGGLGGDYLTGFGGADSFSFTTALGSGNVDQIADFVTGTDMIALDDATFAGIGGPGAFNASAFFAGTAAHDADDRILYDAATGHLLYDADGAGGGAAVLFATLNANPALTASDFQVI